VGVVEPVEEGAAGGGGCVGFVWLMGDVTEERWLSIDGRLEDVGVRRKDGSRGEAMVDMLEEK
jgi:hypothetical protein